MATTRNLDSLAFLFDLDGTLVDSVYQHVLAWREATQAAEEKRGTGYLLGKKKV